MNPFLVSFFDRTSVKCSSISKVLYKVQSDSLVSLTLVILLNTEVSSKELFVFKVFVTTSVRSHGLLRDLCNILWCSSITFPHFVSWKKLNIDRQIFVLKPSFLSSPLVLQKGGKKSPSRLFFTTSSTGTYLLFHHPPPVTNSCISPLTELFSL